MTTIYMYLSRNIFNVVPHIPLFYMYELINHCVCVCLWGGGEGGRKRKGSTRVGRLLSASLACGRPAVMQALPY